MNRSIGRTFAALTLVAALATGSTAALAASPPGGPAFHLTKKRVATLAGLSRTLQTSAVLKARTRPNGPTLTAGGGGTSQSDGVSDAELDILCHNDWFITFDEDENGHGVVGTYKLHCDGWSTSIG
jgi:hypothetical protein